MKGRTVRTVKITSTDKKNAREFFRLNGFQAQEQISASVEWIRIIFCIFVIGLIFAGLTFVIF